MSRAIHLLYLFRYQIGGDFVSTYKFTVPMKYTVSGSTFYIFYIE
jgi:hypothetical protein